jgi:hypothetical protein
LDYFCQEDQQTSGEAALLLPRLYHHPVHEHLLDAAFAKGGRYNKGWANIKTLAHPAVLSPSKPLYS